MKKNKVEVRLSNIKDAGFGLFAKSTIKKGDLISEFTGELIDNNQVEILSSKRKMLYLIDWDENYTLDVEKSDCFAKYANDAEGLKLVKNLKNNSKISWYNNKLFLEATKDIKQNEEIYVSYGKEYWDNI